MQYSDGVTPPSFDEPTTHLDLRHQAAGHDVVRTLGRERGVGCIAVLHDLNLAATYCDRVALLSGGRLLAAGVPEEVLTAVYSMEILVDRSATGLVVLPLPRRGVQWIGGAGVERRRKAP